MKSRWIFFVSLALALSAFFIQWVSIDDYLDARKQQTQDFLHHVETPNLSADALLQKSKILSYFAVPVAAISAFCLFLSYRRKEPMALVWRCGVAVVLALYFYGVIGPI
jgi:lipopolysaccharide export LptBFGC system permease protein LptF